MVQKTGGSSALRREIRPLRSNRSATQLPDFSDRPLTTCPNQKPAHCRDICCFPKKQAGSVTCSQGHQMQNIENKIPCQRGNIQNQGAWDQLSCFPPLLTAERLTWSGRYPQDLQSSLARSLIYLWINKGWSTTGSKSQDLQVTGKSVDNQVELGRAAVMGSLHQTQNYRLFFLQI